MAFLVSFLSLFVSFCLSFSLSLSFPLFRVLHALCFSCIVLCLCAANLSSFNLVPSFLMMKLISALVLGLEQFSFRHIVCLGLIFGFFNFHPKMEKIYSDFAHHFPIIIIITITSIENVYCLNCETINSKTPLKQNILILCSWPLPNVP
jgi:hypothetical protein